MQLEETEQETTILEISRSTAGKSALLIINGEIYLPTQASVKLLLRKNPITNQFPYQEERNEYVRFKLAYATILCNVVSDRKNSAPTNQVLLDYPDINWGRQSPTTFNILCQGKFRCDRPIMLTIFCVPEHWEMPSEVKLSSLSIKEAIMQSASSESTSLVPPVVLPEPKEKKDYSGGERKEFKHQDNERYLRVDLIIEPPDGDGIKLLQISNVDVQDIDGANSILLSNLPKWYSETKSKYPDKVVKLAILSTHGKQVVVEWEDLISTKKTREEKREYTRKWNAIILSCLDFKKDDRVVIVDSSDGVDTVLDTTLPCGVYFLTRHPLARDDDDMPELID